MINENQETEITSPEEVKTKEAVIEETQETEAEAEAEPKEEVKEEKEATAVKDVWRDRFAAAKGQRDLIAKVVKNLNEEGLVDYDDISEKIGQDASYVKSVIEGSGIEDPIAAQAQRFDSTYQDMKDVLQDAYGTDTDEFVSAYKWHAESNPDELELFAELSQKELLSHVMKRGKEVLEDYNEAKEYGGNSVAVIRKLKAEIEALKTDKTEPEEEPEDNQPETKGKMDLNTGGASQAQSASLIDDFLNNRG